MVFSVCHFDTSWVPQYPRIQECKRVNTSTYSTCVTSWLYSCIRPVSAGVSGALMWTITASCRQSYPCVCRDDWILEVWNVDQAEMSLLLHHVICTWVFNRNTFWTRKEGTPIWFWLTSEVKMEVGTAEGDADGDSFALASVGDDNEVHSCYCHCDNSVQKGTLQ